jgi:septal ring factor EnvC (AmiA/AmiB activator)
MRAVMPPIIRKQSVKILKRSRRGGRYACSPKSKDDQTAMIEAILKSIDSRLQSMDARLQNIEVRMHSVENRLDRVESRLDKVEIRLDKVGEDLSDLKTTVKHMPTWKGIGAIAVGMTAALGALITWLASGGALVLSRVFAT